MDSSDPNSSDATRKEHVLSQTLLNKKKKELVDKIMLSLVHPLFNQWLHTFFGAMRQAAHDAECSGQSGSSQAGGKGTRKSTRGQKRQYQRDDEQEDGPDEKNEGGDDGRRNNGSGNKRAKRIVDKGLKFACPYFKHDPAKYRHERTCCGPGFPDAHRVK